MVAILDYVRGKFLDFIFSLKGLLFFVNIFVRLHEYWIDFKVRHNDPKGIKKVILFIGLLAFWIFKIIWTPLKQFGKGFWILSKYLHNRKRTYEEV